MTTDPSGAAVASTFPDGAQTVVLLTVRPGSITERALPVAASNRASLPSGRAVRTVLASGLTANIDRGRGAVVEEATERGTVAGAPSQHPVIIDSRGHHLDAMRGEVQGRDTSGGTGQCLAEHRHRLGEAPHHELGLARHQEPLVVEERRRREVGEVHEGTADLSAGPEIEHANAAVRHVTNRDGPAVGAERHCAVRVGEAR